MGLQKDHSLLDWIIPCAQFHKAYYLTKFLNLSNANSNFRDTILVPYKMFFVKELREGTYLDLFLYKNDKKQTPTLACFSSSLWGFPH